MIVFTTLTNNILKIELVGPEKFLSIFKTS